MLFAILVSRVIIPQNSVVVVVIVILLFVVVFLLLEYLLLLLLSILTIGYQMVGESVSNCPKQCCSCFYCVIVVNVVVVRIFFIVDIDVRLPNGWGVSQCLP